MSNKKKVNLIPYIVLAFILIGVTAVTTLIFWAYYSSRDDISHIKRITRVQKTTAKLSAVFEKDLSGNGRITLKRLYRQRKRYKRFFRRVTPLLKEANAELIALKRAHFRFGSAAHRQFDARFYAVYAVFDTHRMRKVVRNLRKALRLTKKWYAPLVLKVLAYFSKPTIRRFLRTYNEARRTLSLLKSLRSDSIRTHSTHYWVSIYLKSYLARQGAHARTLSKRAPVWLNKIEDAIKNKVMKSLFRCNMRTFTRRLHRGICRRRKKKACRKFNQQAGYMLTKVKDVLPPAETLALSTLALYERRVCKQKRRQVCKLYRTRAYRKNWTYSYTFGFPFSYKRKIHCPALPSFQKRYLSRWPRLSPVRNASLSQLNFGDKTPFSHSLQVALHLGGDLPWHSVGKVFHRRTLGHLLFSLDKNIGKNPLNTLEGNFSLLVLKMLY